MFIPTETDCRSCQSLCIDRAGSKIKKENAFCCAFRDCLYNRDDSITDILAGIEKNIRFAAKNFKINAPSNASFANSRGTWWELICAVTANNLIATNTIKSIIIRLPNRNSLDIVDLFRETEKEQLVLLKESLKKGGIELLTSNPDFICLRQTAEETWDDICRDYYESLSFDKLQSLKEQYAAVIGRCSLSSWLAAIGIKTTGRPDRNIQLVHEAIIVKAVITHLRMRNWNKTAKFSYHVLFAENIGSASELFNNPTPDSIIDIYSRPQKAIDSIETPTTIEGLETAIRRITKDNYD